MNKFLAITVLIVFALLAPARAQGPAPSLVGNWQGTVTFGPQTLRIGLVITAAANNGYNATLVVIDQDGATIPVQQVTLTGTALHLDIAAIKGT